MKKYFKVLNYAPLVLIVSLLFFSLFLIFPKTSFACTGNWTSTAKGVKCCLKKKIAIRVNNPNAGTIWTNTGCEIYGRRDITSTCTDGAFSQSATDCADVFLPPKEIYQWDKAPGALCYKVRASNDLNLLPPLNNQSKVTITNNNFASMVVSPFGGSFWQFSGGIRCYT